VRIVEEEIVVYERVPRARRGLLRARGGKLGSKRAGDEFAERAPAIVI
jgi:hypothetical protein